MKLITIPFSHFCEKGRWALDLTGIPYDEVRIAPVIQRLVVMPLGSLTVPVLIDGRHVTSESNEILRLCDQRFPADEKLFPADPDLRAEVEQLVERFDTVTAPNVRLWFYAWATADPEKLREYGQHGLPPGQRRIMKAALPVISKMLSAHFEIESGTHERAAEIVTGELEFVGDLLADGRPYLVGDHFTAADLAFCAFVGNSLGAPGYGGPGFTPPPGPAELAPQVLQWAQLPVAAWVHGVYAQHRMAKPGLRSLQFAL
ncbi:MAG: glutathione S-transferase family protein [Solirubrobacterales bacterium]